VYCGIAIAGALAAISVAVSCRSNPSISTGTKGSDATTYPFVLGDSYAISPTEMEGIVRDANRGDPKAALRLWHYWGIFRRDQMNAVSWLRKAASSPWWKWCEWLRDEPNAGMVNGGEVY
jgi:hypothetical protein